MSWIALVAALAALGLSLTTNIVLVSWAKSSSSKANASAKGEADARVEAGDLRAQLALAAASVAKAGDAVKLIEAERARQETRANNLEKDLRDAISRPASARPGADGLSFVSHVSGPASTEAVPGGGPQASNGGHGT